MKTAKANTQAIDILKRKKELLLAILDISQKQVQYLKDDEIETLLKELQVRQGLIDEITALEKELSQDPSYQADGSKKLINEIKNILKEIAALDKENCKVAEERVEQYKKQIRELKKDKSRIDFYKNLNGSSDGIYIDKKK